jgi:ATP-dependent DNA helicase RecQ
VRALVAYFGEQRSEACGHCSHCLSGAAELPPATALPAPEAVVAPAVIAALRAEHPAELGQSRQLARFLCGLSSPATTRAKLSRHDSYGVLSAHHFADVLGAISPDARTSRI